MKTAPEIDVNRVRVLFIEQFAVGGLIHYAHCLCSALALRGIDVALLTSAGYELQGLPRPFRLLDRLPLWNPFEKGRASLGGRSLRLERVGKGLRYLLAIAFCLATVWRERPQIVHTSEMKFPIDLLLLILTWPSVVVHTCHNVQRFSESQGSQIVRESRLWRWAQEAMYRRSRGVIFHAAENREEFRQVFGFLPRCSAIIPHGEYGLFAPSAQPSFPEARRKLGIGEDGPLVLFFGALRRYKGLDVLLEAFALLRRRVAASRLLVAGAPLRDVDVEAHRQLARDLGIEDGVVWHVGYVPFEKVHLYFSAANAVAYPYRKVYDSGALKIAQALGRPVVVTDVGGLASAVAGGDAGLIVPPEDPAALAQALERLLCEPRLAVSLAERGREMAATVFSWSSVASETERFYRQVLESRCA